MISIFVGTDRSQLLAVKVLEYSIKRHTDQPVTVAPMHEVQARLPQPSDPKNAPRTGFSFTRFAIPSLMNHQGKAIYMDADMLVFKDVSALWNLPFNGAKLLIQESPPRERGRIRQTAVMLLDCARLGWDASAIIAGLGQNYTYEQLMQRLCILRDEEISATIPPEWNSMEHYEPGRTCLLHYTDMDTQPWVHVGHPLGYLWIDEVRRMLADGALTLDEIEREVALGHFRPSLLAELAGESDIKTLRRIDRAARFKKHPHVINRQRGRLLMQKAFGALRRIL